jgi:ABC-type branched-subunit amino acid transport system substrate-binding protein
MGVIGPFSEETLAVAAPVYHASQLPLIALATCAAGGNGRLDELFCLAADGGALAGALLARMPPDAWPVLLRARPGPLGTALADAVPRTIDAPWQAQALIWRLQNARPRPPDHYLFDGDVLTAASLLVEMRSVGVVAPLWGGPSLARTQLPQVAGQAVQGVCYGITAPIYADLAPGSAFVTGYSALSPGPPGPWAALAYDAATLLLNALETDIIASGGTPSRQGVRRQLDVIREPDGTLVFENGRRRSPDVTLYCYDQGEGYPGHIISTHHSSAPTANK